MRRENRLLLIAIWTLCLWHAPRPAEAETITVDLGGTRVVLPAPEGHCLLDTSRHPDGALIASVKEGNGGMNKLLLFSADCGQLDTWRKQPTNYLSNFAQILTPEDTVTKTISITRPIFVGMLAKAMGHKGLMDQGMSEGNRRAEEVYPKIQINETKSLGVLEVTASALYAGIFQRVLAADGVTEQAIAGVIAMTLVKGKVINVNLYAPFEGSSTVENLLAEQKTVMANLIAAN